MNGRKKRKKDIYAKVSTKRKLISHDQLGKTKKRNASDNMEAGATSRQNENANDSLVSSREKGRVYLTLQKNTREYLQTVVSNNNIKVYKEGNIEPRKRERPRRNNQSKIILVLS